MATPTPLPNAAPRSPGEEEGFCGLTGGQWHLVLKFVVLPLSLVLVAVVIISWLNEKTIPTVLFEAQERVEMARTELREKLFGHLLSDEDVRIITPGANITPRRYPLVDFLLPLLTRVRRGPGSP